MSYNPKQELQVLYAIKELREASLDEIRDELKRKFDIEDTLLPLARIVRRWKKGNVIVSNIVDGQILYSIADVPFPPRVDMTVLEGISHEEAKDVLAELELQKEARKAVVDTRAKYANHKKFKCTFEALDPILGGTPTNKEGYLSFPGYDGVPFIPRRWLLGWLRTNARMINFVTSSFRQYVGVSQGTFVGDVKLTKKVVKGLKGPQTHEAVPTHTIFEFVLRYPMKGTQIKTKDDLVSWFNDIELAPLSGLGSFYGARTKLVKIEEL